jgi:hypothetical protein
MENIFKKYQKEIDNGGELWMVTGNGEKEISSLEKVDGGYEATCVEGFTYQMSSNVSDYSTVAP